MYGEFFHKGLDTAHCKASRPAQRGIQTVIIIYIFVTFTHSNIDTSVGLTKSRAFGVQMLSKYFYFCRIDQK